MTLLNQLRTAAAAPGSVQLASLAQAGVSILTASGTRLVIDPYLSDYVAHVIGAGFARLLPPPIAAEDLPADVVLITHAHPDHLDMDALPIIAARTDALFIGAPDCEAGFREMGLSATRFRILRAGESTTVREVTIRAIDADHGELAAEAIGYLLTVDGITIYNAGDTGFTAERLLASLAASPVDVMLAPINGAYGNLDATTACALAALIHPRMLLGNHVGMFREHGGDPAAFLRQASSTLPGIITRVLASGESITYP